MLTKSQIVLAMKVIRGENHQMNATIKQIIESLLVYKQRGEFSGYIDEAINCLLQAGYEVDGYEQKDEK